MAGNSGTISPDTGKAAGIILTRVTITAATICLDDRADGLIELRLLNGVHIASIVTRIVACIVVHVIACILTTCFVISAKILLLGTSSVEAFFPCSDGSEKFFCMLDASGVAVVTFIHLPYHF